MSKSGCKKTANVLVHDEIGDSAYFMSVFDAVWLLPVCQVRKLIGR